MKSSHISAIVILFCPVIFLSCNHLIDNEKKIKEQIVELYTSKYNFTENPFYEPVYDEFYHDTLHRYYWKLNEDRVQSHLDKFSAFGSESLALENEGSNYKYFGVVFTRKGKILDEGFFDKNLSFTGIHYWYDENWILIEKHKTRLDHKYYGVVFTNDNQGNTSDSTYKFYPIVIPDKDSFEGPELIICFDVRLIIDTRKYNYEDFLLYYALFDSKDTGDTQTMIDTEKIFKGPMKNSTDGHYHFCHELTLKYHLVMGFGIFIDKGVSEEDLTWGLIYGPIINKNIDSHEL